MSGDIIFVRSHTLVGTLVRLFTRGRHEGPTVVNHVGLVMGSGVIEATGKGVQYRRFADLPWTSKDEVAVYGTKLTPAQDGAIYIKAMTYKNRKYGYLKLLAQLGDWMLGNKYFFRRLAGWDKYPICSWVVAHAYKEAGIEFGISANEATPDDIWDYVTSHGWTVVRPLSKWRPDGDHRLELGGGA